MGSSRLWRAVPITAAGLIALASPAPAQVPPPPENRALESLVGKLPPAPPDAAYNAVVLDRGWLVALGKALFWDTGIGSRSDLACASCHFHAGADPRTKNALDPGLNVQPSADPTFGDATSHLTGSGAQAGPNYKLTPADFPFHRLVDPSNRESAVAYDTNDVTSSAGAFDGTLMTPLGVIKINGKRVDPCGPAVSTIFRLPPAATLNTRRVEPRNTPTVVNAAFMRRNFWDGRASNTFNGVDPFGAASLANDPTARVLQAVGTKPPTLQKLQLPNMSAASQAVGPPLSTNEMACGGRTFADIGRRVIKKAALIGQDVAPDDSVLGVNGPHGSLLNTTRKGLAFVYGELIKKAFQKTYWKATGFYNINPDGTLATAADATSGHSQMELNFSLFFGVAIDAYERTLVSDQSPFDQGALSADEQAGLALFQGKAKCVACHDGPLFSKAATFQGDPAVNETIETMVMGDGGTATYDNGFYDIGVRPAFEDLGVGGPNRFGGPLSFARQNPAGPRIAVDGSFKTPSLRNVGLTPPYFHNGGQKSLADVVKFYNRGGDRRSVTGGDTTGTGSDGRLNQGTPVTQGMGGSNLDPDIGDPSQPNGGLGLSATEQGQLVAFLKALTDPRVACHRAPFDHPSIQLSIGHTALDVSPADGNADDVRRRLPAAGAGGLAACNLAQLNSGDLFVNKALSALRPVSTTP